MKKILLIYAPQKGNVEKTANKIFVKFDSHEMDMFPIKDIPIEKIKEYENIIIGCSTVGSETWQNSKNSSWNTILHQVEEMKLEKTKVAIFGLGDQIQYPTHFVDDMKLIYDAFTKAKATIIGEVAKDTYHFEESKAIVGGKFIGLPIDEDQQPELTEKRINIWISDLKQQFN